MWEVCFIPGELHDALAGATLTDSHGTQRPLVRSERLLFESTRPMPPEKPKNWMAYYAILGLLLGGVNLVLLRWSRVSRAGRIFFATHLIVIGLLLGLCGVVGLYFWIFTDHWAAWRNANLLTYSPLGASRRDFGGRARAQEAVLVEACRRQRVRHCRALGAASAAEAARDCSSGHWRAGRARAANQLRARVQHLGLSTKRPRKRPACEQTIMKPRFTFHLIPNAHLDPVWLWDWREGMNEGLVTCRTILDLMDEDPDLTFIRGEAAIYEHIERTDPKTFRRIRKMVKAGRWDIVGGTVIQPDTNLPDTETFARHFLHGQQYFKSRFDRRVRVRVGRRFVWALRGSARHSGCRGDRGLRVFAARAECRADRQGRILVGGSGRLARFGLPDAGWVVWVRTARNDSTIRSIPESC